MCRHADFKFLCLILLLRCDYSFLSRDPPNLLRHITCFVFYYYFQLMFTSTKFFIESVDPAFPFIIGKAQPLSIQFSTKTFDCIKVVFWCKNNPAGSR